jgi:HlyD family secretion protein
MSKKMKYGVAGAVALVLVVLIGVAASKSGAKGTVVRLEGIESRDLVASVTASGQVSAQRKVDVAAEITGRITRLAVKEGDVVREGQFLLQIDPEQFEAQVQRAEAALANSRAGLAQSRANLQQSERNLERQKGIAASNATLVSAQDRATRDAARSEPSARERRRTERQAGRGLAPRRAQPALAHDDLRPDVGPRDASRRRSR